MVTRDSAVWLVAFVASVLVFLSGHFELLTRAFPGMTDVWQARIELGAALTGVVSAFLRMSPLALSPTHPLAGKSDPDQTLNPLKPSSAPSQAMETTSHG